MLLAAVEKNAPPPLLLKLLDKGLDVNAQEKVRSKIRLVLFQETEEQ